MPTPPERRLGAADVQRLADLLWQARREGRTLRAGADTRRLSLDDAYRVQDAVTARRLATGERRIGWKLGYTSAVMRAQMGVAEPNVGPLTDAMLLDDGERLPRRAVQPRVEPEIALVLGSHGRTVRAHAALEVVESVWAGYRFTLAENTADGSSAGWVVLGPELRDDDGAPVPLDCLDAVEVELSVDGVAAGRGRGADADGHPLAALDRLRRFLAVTGRATADGDLVITGGLTRAVPAGGDVTAVFTMASVGQVAAVTLLAKNSQ